ncbi:MAG: ABC transporter ATP-binding protein [Acidobacteria bacterium]|nr:MAG: ABC transporter ATP-binding protein [Acidobacteriota bacterium]
MLEARPERVSKWAVLARLMAHIRQHKPRLALGLLCIICTNVFLLATPWVTGKYAVDGLQESITRQKLAYYAALIIGLTILQGVFRFFTRMLIIGVSRDVEYTLRNELFQHLESLSLSFYQKNKTGELMSRATNDLSNVRMLLGPGIMYTLNTGLIAAFAIVLMLKISWPLTVFSLLPLPLVSYSVRHFGKGIHDLTEEAQAKLADLSARVQESLAGIRVVKAFVQEKHEVAEFDRMNRSLVDKNRELIRVQSVFYPTMELMIGVAVVIVLWFGGRQVIQGAISVGDFVAFNMYLALLTWPMIALGWVVNLFERGRASMERLNYIFDAPADVRDEPGVRSDFQVEGSIEFRNLSFSYNGAPTLRNISLSIPKGKTVAIVGATGSGKSSLVQLIPRLYDAPPNSLFIDGVPVERIPLETLRRAIGFIPQDTFLFGETIRENIAFGVESASDADVQRSAEISNIHEDVQSFPNKFETMVGERGITLSGGQKQRTAISRAVVRDPKILILDDALSSVDTYTEEQILHELKQVMRHRTSILISHRVSTVKEADEIVVLANGAIVERGTHSELLARNGYYAELHQRQLLEEELESAG